MSSIASVAYNTISAVQLYCQRSPEHAASLEATIIELQQKVLVLETSNAQLQSQLAAKTAKHEFPFLKLPAELRNQIYEEVLVSDTPISITYNVNSGRLHGQVIQERGAGWRACVPGALCLLQTCSQIFDEAYCMLYGMNTFHFGGGPTLIRFFRGANRGLYTRSIIMGLSGHDLTWSVVDTLIKYGFQLVDIAWAIHRGSNPETYRSIRALVESQLVRDRMDVVESMRFLPQEGRAILCGAAMPLSLAEEFEERAQDWNVMLKKELSKALAADGVIATVAV